MDQLQFEKLISLAIKREIEAHEFYRDVATRVTETAVKKIFENLAQQEMQHHDLLQKYRQDPSLAIRFKAPEDLKVAESVNEPALSIDMKPADAIALAMKKELQAVEFYRNLADLFDEPDVRETYLNLSNMEMAHKVTLENAFVDIGYPESF